jgi:hexosaminidase
MWLRVLVGAGLMCVFAALVSGQERPQHNLMPAPAEMFFGAGELPIDGTFSVKLEGYRETRLFLAADSVKRRIALQTGIIFLPEPELEGAKTTLCIRVEEAGEVLPALGEDESYRLEINEDGCLLSARKPVGALRGIETFLQLIEPGPKGFRVPYVTISDRPRFPWRGLLVDSCRHWLPPEVIHRTLDAMAAVKLNVLHWHLSEDQGFRVESKVFPRLHQLGSDGNYYTQETIRKIVAYAADRGIRVVPEFDMPGHTTAWLVGHPELATSPGPYKIVRKWGVYGGVFDPTREEVHRFINRFIGEMVGLFPDEYFHIGGDEVDDKVWQESKAIQEFMAREGIPDCRALQAYFNRRLLEILKRHGKKMVGWDEIFHPDLPKNTVIQSWRGQESPAESARQGYYGILSNGYYIDLFLPAAEHYMVDPMGKAEGLSEEERARILGGEACMWGELITPEVVDSRIWPRTAAIAERFWSPADVNDVDDMYRRLEIQSRRLEHLGLNHRSYTRFFLERIVGQGEPVDGLMLLAFYVEPLRGYRRHNAIPYFSFTPLNKFADAVPCENPAARSFNKDVEAMLSSPEGWESKRAPVKEVLLRLRDNHRRILPVLEGSGMLKEIIPLSADMSRLAQAGLEALEFIEKGEAPPRDWYGRYADLLETPEVKEGEEPPGPVYGLEIAIRPGVKKLVDRAINGETK